MGTTEYAHRERNLESARRVRSGGSQPTQQSHSGGFVVLCFSYREKANAERIALRIAGRQLGHQTSRRVWRLERGTTSMHARPRLGSHADFQWQRAGIHSFDALRAKGL